MAKKKKFKPAFDNLPMDQIIGAPLRATASANTMMAREQVKFLMDYCFAKEGENYRPVMVEMVMSRSDITPKAKRAEIKRYNMTFGLPLLTLVPLNSLCVEEFELDFDMEITSMAQSQEQSESTTEGNKAGKPEMKFMGKIGNRDQQKSGSQFERKVNSKLSFHLKGGQLPLPMGLTTIIDLFTKNMEPSEISEDDKVTLK